MVPGRETEPARVYVGGAASATARHGMKVVKPAPVHPAVRGRAALVERMDAPVRAPFRCGKGDYSKTLGRNWAPETAGDSGATSLSARTAADVRNKFARKPDLLAAQRAGPGHAVTVQNWLIAAPPRARPATPKRESKNPVTLMAESVGAVHMRAAGAPHSDAQSNANARRPPVSARHPRGSPRAVALSLHRAQATSAVLAADPTVPSRCTDTKSDEPDSPRRAVPLHLSDRRAPSPFRSGHVPAAAGAGAGIGVGPSPPRSPRSPALAVNENKSSTLQAPPRAPHASPYAQSNSPSGSPRHRSSVAEVLSREHIAPASAAQKLAALSPKRSPVHIPPLTDGLVPLELPPAVPSLGCGSGFNSAQVLALLPGTVSVDVAALRAAVSPGVARSPERLPKDTPRAVINDDQSVPTPTHHKMQPLQALPTDSVEKTPPPYVEPRTPLLFELAGFGLAGTLDSQFPLFVFVLDTPEAKDAYLRCTDCGRKPLQFDGPGGVRLQWLDLDEADRRDNAELERLAALRAKKPLTPAPTKAPSRG